MRIESLSLSLIAVAALAFACKKDPPPAAVPVAQATVAPAVPAPAQDNAIRGKVLEKLEASQYTYLKLQTAEGEIWTAVPKTATAVGATAAVLGPVWMDNFKSGTLNRTWERIAFGTLEGETPPTALGNTTAPARGPAGPGMFAAAAASSGAPANHPAVAPVDSGPIKVARASGPQGNTIAGVYDRKAQLKDKQVSVRGKVVKATNGVMGKNWLHLRDGTGKGGSDDLTIASDDTAIVGATVLVSGTVHLDRDLGAGYRYDVIVEDARVKTE